jgi:hypothetical protein
VALVGLALLARMVHGEGAKNLLGCSCSAAACGLETDNPRNNSRMLSGAVGECCSRGKLHRHVDGGEREEGGGEAEASRCIRGGAAVQPLVATVPHEKSRRNGQENLVEGVRRRG